VASTQSWNLAIRSIGFGWTPDAATSMARLSLPLGGKPSLSVWVIALVDESTINLARRVKSPRRAGA